jgi:hypothetical protein
VVEYPRSRTPAEDIVELNEAIDKESEDDKAAAEAELASTATSNEVCGISTQDLSLQAMDLEDQLQFTTSLPSTNHVRTG